MAQSADRIGLLGGTFSPPHVAHLVMAQEAWYYLNLERVLFIPALQNPLKAGPDPLATIGHRLAMLRLAIKEDARFAVDDCEIKRGRPSYTVDTLMHLQDWYPEQELYLLMGADAAVTLPDWKDVKLFAGLCKIVVCNRPGEADFSQGLPSDLQSLGLRFEFMPLPPLDVSSTEIRRRVRQGKPIRYFAPDGVAAYIHEHGVYL